MLTLLIQKRRSCWSNFSGMTTGVTVGRLGLAFRASRDIGSNFATVGLTAASLGANGRARSALSHTRMIVFCGNIRVACSFVPDAVWLLVSCYAFGPWRHGSVPGFFQELGIIIKYTGPDDEDLKWQEFMLPKGRVA